tara:strand:- start:140 stop:520 length:381 start_codon:yes stop_codon:yes gene_type:complete
MKTNNMKSEMQLWDATWRHHHLPVWFAKVLRLASIKRGERKDWNGEWADCEGLLLNRRLWDHWGSVENKGNPAHRKMVTQPYCDYSKEAKAFAEEHGLSLKIQKPGPWHAETWMFTFELNEKTELR